MKVSPDERWGAVLVSVMVVAFFGGILTIWIFVSVRPENQSILNVLVGALAAAFIQVISYWVGSSSGSKGKDALLLQAAPPPDGK